MDLPTGHFWLLATRLDDETGDDRA